MRIGQLPSVASDQLSDYAAVEQSGATLKTTLQNILNLFKSNTTPTDIGAVSADLLWTNPSPTSSFAAQTIALDLSGYEYVAIDFRVHTGTAKNAQRIGKVGEVLYADLSVNYLGHRDADIQATGITFSAYTHSTSYGQTQNTTSNDGMIPVRIYGIKGF